MLHFPPVRILLVSYLFVLLVGCKKDELLNPLPKADFFFIITNPGELPAVVKFSSVSAHAETWSCDFGDGTISILDKPTTRYLETKVFQVKLVVKNSTGVDSITRNVNISDTPNRPRRIISIPRPDTELRHRAPSP